MGELAATFRALPGDSIDAYLPGYARDAWCAIVGRSMSAAHDETTH